MNIKESQFVAPFPHQGEDIDELQLIQEKPTAIILRDQKTSEFENRFKWLKFGDYSDKKHYYYQGRETEHHSPYYVRFDLKSCESQTQLDQLKKKISDSFAQFMKNLFKKSWEFDKYVNELYKQYQNVCALKKGEQFPDAIVSHGFIFTGLAKTTITVNQIFDLLFLQPMKAKNNQNDSNGNKIKESQSIERKSHHLILPGYTNIRESWQFKRSSYQYIKFMCKAYKQIKAKIEHALANKTIQGEQQISNEDVGQADQKKRQLIFAEMFNQYRYKKISYRRGINETKQINDLQYYQYFYSLISQNYNFILQEMAKYQLKNNKGDFQIQMKQDINICLFCYDYRSYVQSIFKDQSLGEIQIANIIKHYQSYHQAILSDFKFTTSHERVAKLKELQRITANTNNKISLVQLAQPQKHSKREYMLVLYRPQQIASIPFYPLTEFIKKRKFDQYFEELWKSIIASKSDATLTSDIQAAGINKKIFDQYFANISLKGQLYKYFSYSPKNILIFEQNFKCTSSFEHAMCKYLSLSQLPLTLEQKLLFDTPDDNANVYDIIQMIISQMQELQQKWAKHQQDYTQEEIIKLKQICSKLNNISLNVICSKLNNQPKEENNITVIFKVNPIKVYQEKVVEDKKLSLRDKICILFSVFINQEIFSQRVIALNQHGQEYSILDPQSINELEKRIFVLLVGHQILNTIIMDKTTKQYILQKPEMSTLGPQVKNGQHIWQIGHNKGQVYVSQMEKLQVTHQPNHQLQNIFANAQNSTRKDIIDFVICNPNIYQRQVTNYGKIQFNHLNQQIKSLSDVAKKIQYNSVVTISSDYSEIQANIRKCLAFNYILLIKRLKVLISTQIGFLQSAADLIITIKNQWSQMTKIKKDQKQKKSDLTEDTDKQGRAARREKMRKIKQFYNKQNLDDKLSDLIANNLNQIKNFIELLDEQVNEDKVRNMLVILFCDIYEKLKNKIEVQQNQKLTYQLLMLFLFSSPHSNPMDICHYCEPLFYHSFNEERYQFKNCQYKRIFMHQVLQLAKLQSSKPT